MNNFSVFAYCWLAISHLHQVGQQEKYAGVSNINKHETMINPADYTKLVWKDEFDKPFLDSEKWEMEVGKNSQLIIQAKKQKYKSAQYTSARIRTKNKGDWRAGKIEVIKIFIAHFLTILTNTFTKISVFFPFKLYVFEIRTYQLISVF